jgi:hypothetical protein
MGLEVGLIVAGVMNAISGVVDLVVVCSWERCHDR